MEPARKMGILMASTHDEHKNLAKITSLPTNAPQARKVKFRPGDESRALSIEGNFTEALEEVAKIVGAGNNDVGLRYLAQAAIIHPLYETNPAEAYNETLEMIRVIRPTDGLEGMLATQMVSLHNLSMRTMGSTRGENSVEHNSFLAD